MDPGVEVKILRVGETLMVSMGAGSGEGVVALLEAVQPDWAEVEALSAEIARHLTAQRQPRGVLGRLERAGQLLFDQLIGPRVKRALRDSQATHLGLHLQTSLLTLPWELLHDGDRFLCLRFALGRLALSEDEIADPPAPLPQGAVHLLIIADPRGDLPHAEDEGQALVDLTLDHGGAVEPDLLPSPTTRRRVMEALRSYEWVHLAGHGEGGGWLLEDGTLTARDVARLRGGRMPSLLFANACASGTLAGWDPGAGALARAFLIGGTRHFIGACCDLPDHTGITMATAFYRSALAGATVGDALRRGRQALADDRSLPPLAWAGYVLYGEPTTRYLGVSKDRAAQELPDDDVLVMTPTGPVRPFGEGSRPQARIPRRRTRLTPGERRRLALRCLGGALLGAVLGAMAALDVFKVLPLMDAAWLATLEGMEGPRPFTTPLTLVGVGRRVSHPRPLYAELLEGLAAFDGPGPDVVAFDTWFRDLEPGEAPDAVDRRMIAALAASLERFPVVIGQKWEDEAGRPLPPPAWLMEGVRAALTDRARSRCGGCEIQGDPPWWERLALGHVAVERVVEGLFWDLDLRIPFSCEGDGGVPFSWRVAFPRDRHQPLCRAGGWSYGARGESVDIPLDVHRRMLLTWRGQAGWTAEAAAGGFAAVDLASLVASWRGGGASPGALAGQVVLVGRAQADAEASDADRRRTPLGELYGVEVQANAVEALRQRRVPAPARPLWAMALAAAAGALGAAWSVSPRFLVRSAVLIALIAVGSWALWARALAVLTPMASLVTLVGIGLVAKLANREPPAP